jgi:hypothetical protein
MRKKMSRFLRHALRPIARELKELASDKIAPRLAGEAENDEEMPF